MKADFQAKTLPRGSGATIPWLKSQDILALLYLYPVRFLSFLIPPGMLRWLVARAAPLYALARRDLRASLGDRMSFCFEGREPPAPIRHIARSFLARDLHKAVDDLVVRRLSVEELRSRAVVRGRENLDEALSRGKGVIVVSGHFHANRVAKYYLRREGIPMMSARNRAPFGRQMGRFGNRFVAPAYGRFLDAVVEDEVHVRNPGFAAALLRRLRENGIINLHIDAPLTKDVVMLRWLNAERRFPVGFLKLAELTGATIVPMLCLGNSGGFEIHFEQGIRSAGKLSSEEFDGQLKSLAGLLESWVLSHPDEWELWPRMSMPENNDADKSGRS